jgi:hypothetical protein
VFDAQRALKDVSIALLANCFPLPSLSLAFEKSAALSLRFFALFGIEFEAASKWVNH